MSDRLLDLCTLLLYAAWCVVRAVPLLLLGFLMFKLIPVTAAAMAGVGLGMSEVFSR
jgi:hypothetical protein